MKFKNVSYEMDYKHTLNTLINRLFNASIERKLTILEEDSLAILRKTKMLIDEDTE